MSKQIRPQKAAATPVRKGAVAGRTKPIPVPKANKEIPARQAKRPAATRIIAVCNQKGGCGKTTTVINLAAGLARQGLRILVVDLDSQCNATTGLGIEADAVEESTFDALANPKKVQIDDIVLETEYANLHVAPGSIELSEFESRVSGEIGRENRLKKALLPAQHLYDFILIDTPPSLGLLSVNALNAANEVMITLQAHPFSFDGLHMLLDTISLIRDELNPALDIRNVVVTMFDSRTKISHEILEKTRAIPELKGKVAKNVIRQNVRITESSRERQPVLISNPTSPGSQDYHALSLEIAAQRLHHASKSVPSASKSAARSMER